MIVDSKTKRVLSIVIAGMNSGLMIAMAMGITLPPIAERAINFTDATLTAILRGKPLPSPSDFFDFPKDTEIPEKVT